MATIANHATASADAAKYVGTRFLAGDSVTTLAQHFGSSRYAIESILRAALKQLLTQQAAPKAINAADLREIYRAMTPEMRAELLTDAPNVDVSGTRIEE
jgi:hypothetical protein